MVKLCDVLLQNFRQLGRSWTPCLTFSTDIELVKLTTASSWKHCDLNVR